MAYPTPTKTPRKRKNSGSSSGAKRARTRSTRGFRLRRKLVSARRKTRFRRTKPRFKINFPGGRAINVKEDKESYTKTYYRQPVTNQQQKIINKRFKNGYSPFKDSIQGRFQLTADTTYDQAKWIWRTVNTLNYLQKIWQAAPYPAGDQQPGTIATSGTDAYRYGQDQAVYLNAFKYRYEIYNPTNYDMNLVIYDIVYKNDTVYQAKPGYIETSSVRENYDITSCQNPLALMISGIDSASIRYTPTSSSLSVGVSDPSAKTSQDITLKPTESYPFNIHCKIIKKHTYRLQPGASMVHKFIHKPKCLLNRGYYMYRYLKQLTATAISGSSTVESNFRDIAVKDITSGCLFKVWGCVTGTNQSNHNEVVNLTGKLMFKEYVEARWDVMDQKYTYTFVTKNDNYIPGSAMNSKFEIVTKDNIVLAQETDADASNNALPPNASGSSGNV